MSTYMYGAPPIKRDFLYKDYGDDKQRSVDDIMKELFPLEGMVPLYSDPRYRLTIELMNAVIRENC